MGVIGSFAYPFGSEFAMPRTRLISWSVAWLNPVLLMDDGNGSLFGEVPFGGYRVYVKWFAWCYDWSPKTLHLPDIIEDMWAYAPGSGTPTSFGTADLFFEYRNEGRSWCFTIALQGNDGARCFQKLPEYPPGYYNPPNPAAINYPYFLP